MSRDRLRISYYLRKAAALSAARYEYSFGKSDVKPLATRDNRLLAYKAALNARLEAERGPCICKILR